jgi:hypothetical protein
VLVKQSNYKKGNEIYLFLYYTYVTINWLTCKCKLGYFNFVIAIDWFIIIFN